MIDPYQALVLVPTMRGIRRREEISTIDRQVELMHERDIWVRPGKDGPG